MSDELQLKLEKLTLENNKKIEDLEE